MSSVTDIHEALLAGKKITIQCESYKDFLTLRTQLGNVHQIPKLLLELTDDSIVAIFDNLNDKATFYLGAPSEDTTFSIGVILDDST